MPEALSALIHQTHAGRAVCPNFEVCSQRLVQYAAPEIPGNEENLQNTNGLIRWYLPKGTDFAMIDDKMISDIEYALNTRPRKRLGYQTPLEVFTSVALKC